ncbi:MAG: hypothetical protein A3F83_04800 [Candidatus Glassbacteria bacterium RIFCSPLOWO2_12_FULL_58_11]|uniref:Biopolymer transporter ExbD n=2 Tax=Candidatus Glassiibacteriota TaxID=1817805 RepID=A0A1F5YKC5_9BACT|nr:MAG: hypothetical protein A2Z86_06865 [Candidatus Glassbacteria bacterium GWA2_58_10]OGG00616.1 MAG: hypothetical protein A3F83_04800 [Candidatus Glassbacteria bacterium RIFCSPLOWO2_12_FULL_58_11]
MKFFERKRRKATINIVSLVDVVFLLLIFFTVTATFMDQPALKINLPETARKKALETPPAEPMTIFLNQQGELYFGEKPIRIDELPKLIAEGIQQGKARNLIIKADSQAIYGKVINILDLVQGSGLDSISFATQPKVLRDAR